MKKARKGFTLVELLIVVAILGTLSASMMMASQDASPNAEARKIAADLKTIAAAVSVYCAASADAGPAIDYFKSHSDDYLFGTKLSNYTVAADTTNSSRWNATYNTALTGDVLTAMGKIKDSVGVTSTDNKPTMRVK